MKKFLYPFLYICLLVFIFFGLPDKVLYDKRQNILTWLPFILIFLCQPFLLYMICRMLNIQHKISIVVAALSILIFGPLFGIYQKRQQKKELTQHGNQTIGIVYKKWKAYSRHSSELLLRCHFIVNGKEYSTFSVNDDENIYKVGDTLHILYSERNPENCIIVELEKN